MRQDNEPPLRPSPGRSWLFTSLGLTLVVFLGDYLSGWEPSVSIFYLIPVSVAAWFGGTRGGLTFAALSTASWAGAYLLSRHVYSHSTILYWNAGVEGSVFLAMSFAVSRLHSVLMSERAVRGALEAAYRQLDQEMLTVGELQKSLLPAATPDLPGYRFAIHYAPSTRAGGDYYDFFPLPGGKQGILVADASGHGTPAAVLMAMTRTLIHAAPEPLDRPERVLAYLDRQLARNAPEGHFVTACYIVLDPAAGIVEYSLAGHEPPLIVHCAPASIERFVNPSGAPLGLLRTAAYTRQRACLKPDDTLLLHTDGLTEALSPEGELFGRERVERLLIEHGCEEVDALKDSILNQVSLHAGYRPLTDDLTLIVVRRG